MKLFLCKLLLVIIPIGSLLGAMELWNRKNDQSSNFLQKQFILNNRHNLDGLIFGSSYMWCSIHPQYLDSKVASLALVGSAPTIDYSLFTYAKKLAKPKFILLDGSRTYFWNTQDHEFIKSTNLSYYFPTLRSRALADHFLTTVPLRQHFRTTISSRFDQWGKQTKYLEEQDLFHSLNYQDSLIANHPQTQGLFTEMKSIISANNISDNLKLCRRMLKECLKEKIEVIFISPPKYYLFNRLVDQQHLNERDAFMREIVDNHHVFFLNYEHFQERNATLFLNANHVNNEGAKLFSKKLNSDLHQLFTREEMP